MKPTKHLDESVQLIARLNFGARATNRLLNLLGLVLLFIFGWLFLGLTAVFHPTFFSPEILFYWRYITLPRFLILMIIVIGLHEFIHWLAYWIVVKERPSIRPNFLYYYAASPGWFIPQKQYIFIRLAPFILLTLIGTFLLANAKPIFLHDLVIALPINAAGSINDFYVTSWLIKQKKSGHVRDNGPEIKLYHAPH